MLRRVLNLFSGDKHVPSDNETAKKHQTNKKKPHNDKPTSLEFATALLGREPDSGEETDKPVYVLDELDKEDQKQPETGRATAPSGRNLLPPQTPAKAGSMPFLSSTPLALRLVIGQKPARRRYKRYDVSAKRRVINPLLELEDDSPDERPLQVLQLEEGSESMKKVESSIMDDLERQLKENNGSDDDDEEVFVEAVSQIHDEEKDSGREVKVEKKMPWDEAVEVTEVASQDSEEKQREDHVDPRDQSVPVDGDLPEIPSKAVASPKNSPQGLSGTRKTLKMSLSRKRRVRKVHRDAAGNWTTRESQSDSDVFVVGEERASEVESASQRSGKLLDASAERSHDDGSDPIDDNYNTASESDDIEDSSSEDISENKPTGTKPRAVNFSDISTEHFSIDPHAATELPKTPVQVSNRYPIAPALAPGRVVFGSPALAPASSRTQPPTSQTDRLDSKPGTLPTLVRQAKSGQSNSQSSPNLFVSVDSSSGRSLTLPSTASSPTSLYRKRLKQQMTLPFSLPPRSLPGRSRTDNSYRIPFSSQTNSTSSEPKDQLMVPDSSTTEELNRQASPPKKVLSQESQIVIKSSQDDKEQKKPAPAKPRGTLPTAVKPAVASPKEEEGDRKRIKLIPMYSKLMRPEPAKPEPKSLAQQLRERREQLEGLSRAETA